MGLFSTRDFIACWGKVGSMGRDAIRAREAVDTLQNARELLTVGASSLVRAGDDDGLYYANELHRIANELVEHMKAIKANAE